MSTSLLFNDYFNHAEVNSIIVMDINGYILEINDSFTKNFGYKDELKGEHFNILFTETDKKENKPAIELQTVLSKRQANDDNYVMDKNGQAIWCTGEAILVSGTDGQLYIVKDIVNLQSKKQLNLFLKDTEELLEHIFETSKELPMMVIDGSMKVVKVNMPFVYLFNLRDAPSAGSRLIDIDHPFWHSGDIKKEISNILVTNRPIKRREYLFDSKPGQMKMLQLDSKIIHREPELGRLIFVILEDITPKA